MIIEVRVKPGSKKGPLIQPAIDGSLLVYVREPAVEGKANRALVEMLADYYDVSKSKVHLITGLTSRLKRFKIDRD